MSKQQVMLCARMLVGVSAHILREPTRAMTKSCKSPTPHCFSLSLDQELENTFLRALEQNQQKLLKARNRSSDYLLS